MLAALWDRLWMMHYDTIVFGSGYVSIPQMAKSAIGLNFIGIALAVVVTYVLVIPVFDVVIGEVPIWTQVLSK